MADYKLINGRISSPPRANSAKGRGRGPSRVSSGHKNSGGGTTHGGQGGPGIPIHVDGSRDELSNVDPDLTLAELELRLLHEGHAGSSRPGSSSRRSVRVVSSSASTMAEADGSRARPIKPHENEPFLTIGNIAKGSDSKVKQPETPKKERLMPKRNVQLELKARVSSPSHSHSAGGGSRASTPHGLSGHSRNLSPSMSMGYLSDRSQGQRILSRMYASSNASSQRANPRIKMPFKHNIRKPSEKINQEPAQEMMEMTALATYQVNRILASENGAMPKKKHGRLKKGKLQPLYPVSNTGPSISQCRGILSETRSFSASASRTLQRRRHIVSQLKSGKLGLHGDASLPKDGRESVHIVSAASSVEDVAEAVEAEEGYPDFQTELASMEHDAMFSQELEQKMSFSRELTEASQGRFSTDPAKTPVSLDQDIADLQNPDFSTPHPPANSTTTSSTPAAEERMEVSEVKGQSQTGSGGTPGDSGSPARAAEEAAGEKEMDSIGGIGPGVNNANNNFRMEGPPKALPDLRRPQSASVRYSEPVASRAEAKARPRTAAPGKAVRFAERTHSSDGSTLPVSRQDLWLDRGKGRNGRGRKGSGEGVAESSSSSSGGGKADKGRPGKPSAGSSCKPTDLGSSKRDVDDDDGDDDGGRGGGDGGGSAGGGGGGVRRQAGSGSNTSTGGKGGAASTGKDSQPKGGQQGKTKEAASGECSNSAQGEAVPTEARHSLGAASEHLSHPALSTAATGSDSKRATESNNVCEHFIRHSETRPSEEAPVSAAERTSREDHAVRDAGSLPQQHDESSRVPSQSCSDSSASVAESGAAACTPPGLSWSTIIGERDGSGAETMTPVVVMPPPATLSVKLETAAQGHVPEGSSLLQLLLDASSDVGDQLPPSQDSSHSGLSDNPASPPQDEDPSVSGPSSRSSGTSPASPRISSQHHPGDASTASSHFLGVAVDAVERERPSKHDRRGVVIVNSGSDPRRSSIESWDDMANMGQSAAGGRNDLCGGSAAEQLLSTAATNTTTTTNATTASTTITTNPKKAAPPSSVTTIMHSANSVNPRVTVLVCKHDYASDKKPAKAASKSGRSEPRPQAGEERNDEAEEKREEEEEEDSCYSNWGNKYHGKNIHGNRLTELFTHLSLGVGSGNGRDAHRTLSSHRPRAPASILKQKSGSVHCLRKRSFRRAQHPVEAGEGDNNASASGRSSHQPAAKGVRSQQIFTHHSNEPFVYPSGDPFSKAVAQRLKFGDSPYLKEMKVPPMPGARARKSRDKKDGAVVLEEKPMPREKVGSLHSEQYHRPTRVKFANYSMPFLDLNQNCDDENEYYSAVFGLDDDYDDDDCYHYRDSDHFDNPRYSGKRVSYASMASDGGGGSSRYGDIDDDDDGDDNDDDNDDDHYHSDCDSAGDFGARFSALESELNAVRSEIKLTMLDRQAEQLLEDDLEQGNYSKAVGADNGDADDDNNNNNEDSDYVYEDDGTSDDEDYDEDNEAGLPTGGEEEKEATREEGDDEEDKETDSERQTARDEDLAYSTYFRALLREYRNKCRTVGKGSLVMSEKLTWPYSQPQPTHTHHRPSSSTCPGNPPLREVQSLRVRPHSAGCFRTLRERRNDGGGGRTGRRRNSITDQPPVAGRGLTRAASLSDSGWESEGLSAFGGRLLDHWSSCLSVGGESVPSSRCNSSAGHRTGERPLSGDATTDVTADRELRKDAFSKVAGSRPSSGREEQPNLTVVASSAPKIPAKPKVMHQSELGPPAPFPPLCFAVNARPPPGSLFFFAYCTFMNPDRLGSLLNMQLDKRYWAVLFGFDLSFNKKGSEVSSGGLANIVFNPFSSVEGCVFLLTPSELDKLDALTSAPQQYTRVVLPVWMSEVSGSADDLGLAKYCVPAVTYIAQDEWTLKDGCSPNEFVASQCLKSADLLTPNYCDRLRSMVSAASKLPASQPVIS